MSGSVLSGFVWVCAEWVRSHPCFADAEEAAERGVRISTTTPDPTTPSITTGWGQMSVRLLVKVVVVISGLVCVMGRRDCRSACAGPTGGRGEQAIDNTVDRPTSHPHRASTLHIQFQTGSRPTHTQSREGGFEGGGLSKSTWHDPTHFSILTLMTHRHTHTGCSI